LGSDVTWEDLENTQTMTILYLLRAQETKLKTETSKAKRKKSVDTFGLVNTHGVQFRCKLLKEICNVLWAMHLLKTSIFVTKTPLTTLKSLSKTMTNQVFRERK